jgi:protein ImuB
VKQATSNGQPTPFQPDPVLIVAASYGKQLVVQACERAQSAGIKLGITLAHARSLLHGTHVHVMDHTPVQDGETLNKLARWMHRFSPLVAADHPDGLLADVSGCEQVFGGEQALVDTTDHALKRLSLRTRVALAPTFGCAWAVARYGDSDQTIVPHEKLEAALAPLPISGLRIEPKTCVALSDVAIERIGQLFAIPRAELAARFDRTLLNRLDQALGKKPETITPLWPETKNIATHEFSGLVRNTTIIQNVAGKLLADLLKQLERRGRAVLRFVVTIQRSDLPPEILSLSLSYPTRDEHHVWKLFAPKLERMNLGYGIVALEIEAVRTAPLVCAQRSLSPDLEPDETFSDTALGVLLDQFIHRLGAQAVTTIQPCETHVPERAFVAGAMNDVRRIRSSDAATYDALRPSRLFRHPEPVRVVFLVPDGPPAWMQWQGWESNIRIGLGPERITLPWWNDDSVSTRDYFAVQTDAGRWFWLFRSGDSGQWFIHGEWA